MPTADITITSSGFSVNGPLVAGEQVSVSVSGVELAEDAALSLAMTARFPDALLASCELAESEETPGTWTGTLDTCTKQTAFYFQTARADEARSIVLELVDTAHRESIARISAPLVNSSLLPSPFGPCGKDASPVYIPVPGEPGEPGDAATITIGTVTELPSGSTPTVSNSGTAQAAVLDFGIPGMSFPVVVNPPLSSGRLPCAAGKTTSFATDAYPGVSSITLQFYAGNALALVWVRNMAYSGDLTVKYGSETTTVGPREILLVIAIGYEVFSVRKNTSVA